jgi:VCBS repeat-containing protein
LQAAFVADDVDSDDDQGTLTYELLGQPSGGTVTNNNDGTFSFDPGHDFDDLAEGETRDVTVTYRAVDSHGAVSNEAVITITVRGVGSSTPQPPVVEDQSFAVAEESVAGAAVGTVLATDADSTALSYAIVEGNDLGLFAIDAATGDIRLAQGVDDPEVGSYALRVAVSDGDNTTTANVTVEVTPVNDAPVAADGAATTAQDTPLTGALPAATDVENDPVAYTVGTRAL